MSLPYRLILRPDMTKNASPGSKLYYGQLRTQQKIDFKKLCEMVSGHCTATKGEVELVIDGLIYVLKQQLAMGSVVQMGEFGNFRVTAGSKGAAWAKDFTPSLFKKGRIVFTPSVNLKKLLDGISFEKMEAFTEPDRPDVWPNPERPEEV